MRSKSEIEDCRNRIVKYASEHLYISQREFAMRAGLSPSFIKNFGGVLRPQTKAKLEKAYPDLNIDWLLTGEGEMLKPTDQSPVIITNNKTIIGNNSGNCAGGDISLEVGKSSYQAIISALRAELAAKEKEIERQQEMINKLIDKITQNYG